jgi:protein SCO1/2
MKNKKQTGILLLLVAIPVFFILLLQLFGRNEFSLPEIDAQQEAQKLNIYSPKSVDCPGFSSDELHEIPPITFTSAQEKQVNLADLKGHVYVANFFFTRCPNICLTMTSELLRVQERYADAADFEIVSVSVDPENDNLDVLNTYASTYGIDQNQWHLLRGTREQVRQLATCGLFVVSPQEADSPDAFVHSDKLVLIDRQGHIRGFYSGTDPEDVDRLLVEIELLLNEKLKA